MFTKGLENQGNMHSEHAIRIAEEARLRAVAATGLGVAEIPDALQRQVRLSALALGAAGSAFLVLEEKSFRPMGFHGLPASLAALNAWPLEWSFLLDAAFSGPHSGSMDGVKGFPAAELSAFFGAPVEDAQGHCLGVLAVWGSGPRTWSSAETEILTGMAATLADLIPRAWSHPDSPHSEIETILKSLFTPVFVFNGAGEPIYVNDAVGRMMGNPDARTILPSSYRELLTQIEILDQNLKPISREDIPSRRALRGEVVVGFLTRYRIRTTGASGWAVTNATPVFDEKGAVRLVVSSFEDVTAIKDAELELSRSRNELAVMLRTMESGCTAQTPDGALVYANDAAARMLGVPDADALINADLDAILSRFEILDENRMRFRFEQLPGRLALQGTAVTGKVMCYRIKATGEERWSLVNATPVLDDQGKVRLCINVFNDITALKHAEDQIRKSRNQLEIVLAGVDDSILVTESAGEGRIVFANEEAARLLDYPSVEALLASDTRALDDRFIILDESGEGMPPERRPAHQAAHGVASPRTVQRIRSKSGGKERWVMAKSVPIFSADGVVEMIVNISQDITEVRRAEQSVIKHMRYLEGMNHVSGAIESSQETERMMPSALEKLLDVFDCDRAWLIHLGDSDSAGRHRVAFSAERPGPQDAGEAGPRAHSAPLLSGLIPAESGFESIVLACRATEQPVVFGRERPLPNPAFWRNEFNVGSAKAISVRPHVGRSWILCLLRSPEAQPWLGQDLSLFKDVSSRIAAALGAMLLHRDMRRSEEKYRTLFERSVDGIYRCAADGTVLDANPALVTMLGYADRSQLVGTLRPRLLPAGAGEDGHSDKVETFSVELERERAVPVWVEVNAQPIRGADGILYFEGIVRNINDRKRAEDALKASEEKLRQSQKMEAVGRLAGGVAHDFNNLLTAINGFSDLLLMSVPKTDDKRVHIEEIRKAGGRAAELTSQLLSFSRKQVMAPRLLDLNAVVLGMETMLRRLIGENIGFHTSLDQDLPKVVADPGQMEQVILNLVLNARDAMPDGGQLKVATSRHMLTDGNRPASLLEVPSGEYALLKVTDDGTGMDTETLSRLFEPFFTTKSKDKGTGLGLSTVYGAIKHSNGTINVESELGKGSRFSIYLPAAAKQAAPEKSRLRERALRSLGGNETVLLVEDEDAVRRLVRDVLEVGGYKVFEAPGGEEALELLESHIRDNKVHLLLTDVVMGGMSGRELAERLKAKRPHTKVLFMSGYTEDAIIRHGIYTAQAAFIGKPFSPAAIAAKVREVLDAPEKETDPAREKTPGKAGGQAA
jgi:PAS domain S-box-containing protein